MSHTFHHSPDHPRCKAMPCRDCGTVFPYDPHADRCEVCTLSASGDVLALCQLASAGSAAAASELYHGFGVNDEDRASLLSVAARV